MSKGTLGQVVKRAISDAAFRRQLQADPEGALKGFDLTSDERAALRSGDASKLSGFGIDQRMSKAFTMGEGALAASKAVSGGELSDSSAAQAAFIDQDSVGGGARAGLIDQGAGGGRATLSDSDRLSQVNAAFEGGDSAAGGRALGDQHDVARSTIGDSPASAGRSALGDQHDGGRAAIGGTQDYGQQTSLDVSGNTRDATAISGDTAGGREGTAYITADEAGRDASPAAMASSDSNANTAFMTSDEMGTGVTGAQTSDGDTASDALQPDATAPWNAYENPEHQG